MNPPRLVATACLLLVLLAFVGRLLSNPEVVQPGPPSLPGTRISYLAAQVPPIGDFDHEFHVNLENPFVPIQARRDEKEAFAQPPVVMTKNLPPPGKPVVVEAPILVLPKAKGVDVGRPECLGVISHGRSGREVLITRLPGGAEQQLERGGRLGDWELLGLTPGGARFRDPKGVEQEVPFVAPDPAANPMPAADPAGAGAPAVEPAKAERPAKRPEREAATPPRRAPTAPRVRPIPPLHPGGGGVVQPPPPPLPRPAPEMVPRPPAK